MLTYRQGAASVALTFANSGPPDQTNFYRGCGFISWYSALPTFGPHRQWLERRRPKHLAPTPAPSMNLCFVALPEGRERCKAALAECSSNPSPPRATNRKTVLSPSP